MFRTVFILFVLAAASFTFATAEPHASSAPSYRYAPSRKTHHFMATHLRYRTASGRRRTVSPRFTGRRASQRRLEAPRELARRDLGRRELGCHSGRRSRADQHHARMARRSAARQPDAPAARRDAKIAPAAPLSGPALQTASYRRRPRFVMPPPLLGSLASLERQNERTEAEGLVRILDDNDLNQRIASHLLVPVPVSAALTVNPDLPLNHRYCRPWTARFLSDLARAHAARFHTPLEVNSAVRTVAYQKQLMRVNGNAAAAEGAIVSPHLTGAAIDIAKHGLTLPEIAWMRTRLLALELAGKIDVEEEFEQACFHITVYKSYVPAMPRRSPPGRQLAWRGQ